MNILFYRYGSICEPDLIAAFREYGITVYESDDEITELTFCVNCFCLSSSSCEPTLSARLYLSAIIRSFSALISSLTYPKYAIFFIFRICAL